MFATGNKWESNEQTRNSGIIQPTISREFQGINRNGSPVVAASKETRRTGRRLLSRLQLHWKNQFMWPGREKTKPKREINKAASERKNRDRSRIEMSAAVAA
jgi:hypothetical protein